MPYSSPFFSTTTGYSGEQSLVDDLVREQIKLYGTDILYMPRMHLNHDKLLHEGSKSAFEIALPIPMYMKSFSGYQNGMEILSKFGVRSSDEITMVMSRSEFITHYSPFIQGYYELMEGLDYNGDPLDKNIGHTAARPKEGDLIYFPFDDGIFEIKYVMFDQPFFQLGQGFVFEIQCEKFEFSGETFNTGIEAIDDTQVRPDYYRLEFTMENGGYETFKNFETVKVIDYKAVSETAGTSGELRMFADPGFLKGVPYSTAKVMEWNKPKKKLLLGDFSEVDPDQKSYLSGDIDINKFDTVMVIGDETGAVWISEQANQMESAFTDNSTIQEEFNEIKILDLGDESPFGFF